MATKKPQAPEVKPGQIRVREGSDVGHPPAHPRVLVGPLRGGKHVLFEQWGSTRWRALEPRSPASIRKGWPTVVSEGKPVPEETPKKGMDWKARALAAEADNAALLAAGERIYDLAQHDEACRMLVGDDLAMCDCAMGDWQEIQRRAARGDHPGAALLECLRKAVSRLREFSHAEACDVGDPFEADDTDGCTCVLAVLPELEALLGGTR